MSLLLSVSNQVCKLTKQDFPRMLDKQGNNPGIQSIETDSAQVAWQCQVTDFSEPQWRSCGTTGWAVMFVESHSRYTMVKTYLLKPDWELIEEDFKELWLEHVLTWMEAGGFIRSIEQAEQVTLQFVDYLLQAKSQIFRNYDRSIGGHLADNQQWMSAYVKDLGRRYFDDSAAWDLCDHLNQQIRRTNKQRGKKHEFQPIERFLDDSLYRFAHGICDLPIPGCAMGDFPNPYQRAPKLRVV